MNRQTERWIRWHILGPWQRWLSFIVLCSFHISPFYVLTHGFEVIGQCHKHSRYLAESRMPPPPFLFYAIHFVYSFHGMNPSLEGFRKKDAASVQLRSYKKIRDSTCSMKFCATTKFSGFSHARRLWYTHVSWRIFASPLPLYMSRYSRSFSFGTIQFTKEPRLQHFLYDFLNFGALFDCISADCL